jgi:hypothetical protein
MASKLKLQTVSRAGLAPLVDMAEFLRSFMPGWEDTRPLEGRARVPSVLGADLDHLARVDSDGFLTVSMDNDVVGFASSHIRSRQLVLPQVWVLPEAREHGVAEALMRRTIGYGERSGATDCVAHVLGGAVDQAICLRFGLKPRFPVYRMSVPAETARQVGMELAKLLPGSELTKDVLARRSGAADLERLDKLARGIVRPMDHEYWLGTRNLRLAKVRDGQRVGAYAYGGAGHCGPVAATTKEAALAGLGWALQLAADDPLLPVELLVPAPFESAMEQLLDAKASCLAVSMWMTRQPVSGMDRYILPSTTMV